MNKLFHLGPVVVDSIDQTGSETGGHWLDSFVNFPVEENTRRRHAIIKTNRVGKEKAGKKTAASDVSEVM